LRTTKCNLSGGGGGRHGEMQRINKGYYSEKEQTFRSTKKKGGGK